MTQAWNPTFTASGITLSSGNLHAVSSGTDAVVRASVGSETFAVGANKYYWELTVSGEGFNADDSAIGLANDAVSLSTFLGTDAAGNGLGMFMNATDGDGVYYKGTKVSADWSGIAALGYTTLAAASGLIGIAWDNVNHLFYIRYGTTGNWNGSATANPATQTGGVPINATLFTNGNVAPAIQLYHSSGTNGADTITAAFAQASWTGTPPSGFGPFDSSDSLMAQICM